MNLDKEMDTFFASAYKAAPQFTYAKSESCIKQAFSENCNVCFELLPEAERILARVKTEYGSSEAFLDRLYGDEKTDPDELRQKILQYLKDHNMMDRVKVRIVENGLSAASVNKAYCPKRGRHFYTVNIAKVPFSSNMIQGTCDHEIGTHLIRMRNDEMQVWHGARDKFKLGNPWVTEEGFATLNTYQSMPCKLLFPQALRYYAVCRGATLGFVELFHELQSYVDNPKLNWQMCCRVKRGLFDTSQPGAFNMDQAYFKGAVEILRHFSEIDLVQLYSGQVALQDLDKIKFLHRREEVVLPWFLNCPEALETYKEHCHELIHENQIACGTGRRPTFFRAAADLLKRIPRWTKATPAFLQRKVQCSPTYKPSSTNKKSTNEQDHVTAPEKVPKPQSCDKADQTHQSEEHKTKIACSIKVRDLTVGRYKITYEGIRVGPEAELGHAPITHLPRGTEVNVLEVVEVEHRIRARIDHPAGWISLMNTDSGFLWATLDSTLVSPDELDNLQDGDQKQARTSDHQPQEESHSEKQGRNAEQTIQNACDTARLEEHGLPKDVAQTKHSPQPQDGMLETEANRDEFAKVRSDLPSDGNACVAKGAAKVDDASIALVKLTDPPKQTDTCVAKHEAKVANAKIASVNLTGSPEQTEACVSHGAAKVANASIASVKTSGPAAQTDARVAKGEAKVANASIAFVKLSGPSEQTDACAAKDAAKVASALISCDDLKDPPEQRDALPKIDDSSCVFVVESSSSIAAEIVTDCLETVENRSSNDASHRDIEDATASTTPVAQTKSLKTGDSPQKPDNVQDLSSAVRDLADAVKEWKLLKSSFDENASCEVAERLDVESSEARFLRRWSRRSWDNTAQDVEGPGGKRVSTGSICEEKSVERKSRQRHKRKSKKPALKRT